MRFFSTLGFEFNKQFTNENGACMMISDEAFVMLQRAVLQDVHEAGALRYEDEHGRPVRSVMREQS